MELQIKKLEKVAKLETITSPFSATTLYNIDPDANENPKQMSKKVMVTEIIRSSSLKL